MLHLISVSENKTLQSVEERSQLSDGYHTFEELYRYRLLLNAMLFNQWQYKDDQNGNTIEVTKSWKHSDGELCFGGGWFIVMAQLPTGQVSNHYEAKDWDLFDIAERETAPEYDGHSPEEAANRMEKYLRGDYERVG